MDAQTEQVGFWRLGGLMVLVKKGGGANQIGKSVYVTIGRDKA
jgi:hypothetical protein